ncbi:12476_t:CDS:2 [Gigaspora margarita]|uniref:12476_t:CDS:1 n=1 Tax=Gigaspora margarita TaxID=4874 RepID=A0ABN7VDG1_GIGMA|nr:12476_t:CDS:2 [Gigaspora margarita]
MKIQSHVIPINTKNTPSTSKDSARVYYFSLIEHIQHILKNPTLSSYLYFGPGVFSKSCKELWEGDLWAKSPLFSLPNLVTMQVPFGGNFKDIIKVFIEEVQQLEQGFIMNVNGVLRYNANFECRSCKASKNELINNTFDIYSNGQYQQITNQEFKNISEQQTNLARLQMSSHYGLRLLPASKNVFSSAINRSSGYYQLQETLDKELNALIEEIENARFISDDLEANRLLASIMNIYSLYFSIEQAILNMKIRYYQNASYSIVKSNSDFQDVRFCVSEAVETTLSNDGQPVFRVVKGIIEYKWNDNQVYMFIYLEWLKFLNKFDDLLGCPIYHLQRACKNDFDRIYLISIVSKSPNTLFIHICKFKYSSL